MFGYSSKPKPVNRTETGVNLDGRMQVTGLDRNP
jgi:hypothetical protein